MKCIGCMLVVPKPLRLARDLRSIWKEGGGGNIHIFVLSPTNLLRNRVDSPYLKR